MIGENISIIFSNNTKVITKKENYINKIKQLKNTDPIGNLPLFAFSQWVDFLQITDTTGNIVCEDL
jgi:hypothetical protein